MLQYWYPTISVTCWMYFNLSLPLSLLTLYSFPSTITVYRPLYYQLSFPPISLQKYEHRIPASCDAFPYVAVFQTVLGLSSFFFLPGPLSFQSCSVALHLKCSTAPKNGIVSVKDVSLFCTPKYSDDNFFFHFFLIISAAMSPSCL